MNKTTSNELITELLTEYCDEARRMIPLYDAPFVSTNFVDSFGDNYSIGVYEIEGTDKLVLDDCGYLLHNLIEDDYTIVNEAIDMWCGMLDITTDITGKFEIRCDREDFNQCFDRLTHFIVAISAIYQITMLIG